MEKYIKKIITGDNQYYINDAEARDRIAVIEADLGTGGSVDDRIAEAVNTEKTRSEGVESDLDARLQTVEQLAEISIDGGTIGIAIAEDFDSDDPSDLAKVPTVDAILDATNDTLVQDSIKPISSGAVYDAVQDLKISVVHSDVTTGTVSLDPNTLYVFDDVIDNIVIQTVDGEAGKLSEYMLQFTCGEGSQITFPNGTLWANDNVLEPEQGYTYQVSIINNLAIYAGWEVNNE